MTTATLSSLQTSKAQSLLRRKIWMLILEAMKKTSSAKPRNPCQSNSAEDCLNYSTLIPTGWIGSVPPKYMITGVLWRYSLGLEKSRIVFSYKHDDSMASIKSTTDLFSNP